MGYTHYFQGLIPASATSQLLLDVQKLLTISSSEIPIYGPSGTGPPILSPELISLNGQAEEDAHESLDIPLGVPIDFGFCKTARKPYDTVVGAVLLRCSFYSRNHHNRQPDVVDGQDQHQHQHQEFTVSSDGCWEEWEDARELYRRTFETEASMPEGMVPSWGVI